MERLFTVAEYTFFILKLRNFEIKSKDSKLPVIDKLYINGGFLFNKNNTLR